MKAAKNGEEKDSHKTSENSISLTLRNTIRKSSSPLIARTGFFKLFSTHWTGWREEPQSPTLKQALCRDGSKD